MKTLIIPLLMSLFFFACKDSANNNPTSTVNNNAALNTNCNTQCSNETPYKISPSCGECMIQRYQQSGTRVLNPLEMKGFEININELRDILTDSTTTTVTKVFAMLAVGNTANSELDIVFQVVNRDASGKVSEYYDFTKPCPNACP